MNYNKYSVKDLIDINIDEKIYLVTVRALQRSISDHTPLILDSSEAAHLGNKAAFSFETY